MSTTPADDHDWMIHSINIHGVFFERWCQSVVAKSGPWKLSTTNYPVAFPPPDRSFHSQESSLDIAAEQHSFGRTVSLLIECKKNNPEFVNWIFFPKPQRAGATRFSFHQLEHKRPNYGDGTEGSELVQSFERSAPGLVIADEARETRSSYSDFKNQNKTRTSNAAITDAARQVALATQALAFEEVRHVERHGFEQSRLATPSHRMLFVPAIVTTARLFTCGFDPDDVDPATGEIDYAKATLDERSLLIYEYPIPRPLQFDPDEFRGDLNNLPGEPLVKMHIVVIQSKELGVILGDLGARLDL